MPVNLVSICEPQDGIRGELGAVVADNHLRHATCRYKRFQLSDNPQTREGCISDERQAFARAVIRDRRTLNRRPSVSWSETKSSDQRSLGAIGMTTGARVFQGPFFRQSLRRTESSLECYPTCPQDGLEFSGPNQEHGLAACSDFIRSIGTLLPMAP
jgi:hypothetical protein